MKIKLPINFALLLTLGLSSCDSGYADSSSISYEEAKLSIEQQEKLYPLNFVDVDGTYRKNFIGEWVLEGKINSTATLAKYKDVVLDIKYYSKTETLIGRDREIIYDYLAPGSNVKFKIKTFGPKGAKSVGIDIADAATAN
ncbi:hypothetical protein O71_18186 [Pontibacter sp. BAB1700]|nr:hypothetical protein O71_18186 [Pontibacter sp. BAB1700]